MNVFRRCVRCGARERSGGTFLCLDCRNDPATAKEAADAGDRLELMVRYGWVGGWNRAYMPIPESELRALYGDRRSIPSV